MNTENKTCYQRYATKTERSCANALIDAILAKGATISVFDGECFCLKKSSSKSEIKANLCTAEDDTLRIRLNGEIIGAFYLIWGDGNDPMELISDYSANEFCEGIHREVSAKVEG
jgi:hypothetical protein